MYSWKLSKLIRSVCFVWNYVNNLKCPFDPHQITSNSLKVCVFVDTIFHQQFLDFIIPWPVPCNTNNRTTCNPVIFMKFMRLLSFLDGVKDFHQNSVAFNSQRIQRKAGKILFVPLLSTSLFQFQFRVFSATINVVFYEDLSSFMVSQNVPDIKSKH